MCSWHRECENEAGTACFDRQMVGKIDGVLSNAGEHCRPKLEMRHITNEALFISILIIEMLGQHFEIL